MVGMEILLYRKDDDDDSLSVTQRRELAELP